MPDDVPNYFECGDCTNILKCLHFKVTTRQGRSCASPYDSFQHATATPMEDKVKRIVIEAIRNGDMSLTWMVAFGGRTWKVTRYPNSLKVEDNGPRVVLFCLRKYALAFPALAIVEI